MSKQIEETIFDRIGLRLIWVAETMLLYSRQVSDARKLTKDVIRSQREIEALDKEAVKQLETNTRRMETAVKKFIGEQVDILRALQVSQEAQAHNRQSIEALEAHLAEMDLDGAQANVAGLATILGHKNYRYIVQGDADLWEWLLGVVDGPVFAEAYRRQELKRQNELVAGIIADDD